MYTWDKCNLSDLGRGLWWNQLQLGPELRAYGLTQNVANYLAKRSCDIGHLLAFEGKRYSGLESKRPFGNNRGMVIREGRDKRTNGLNEIT